jgi:hypothetical protein
MQIIFRIFNDEYNENTSENHIKEEIYAVKLVGTGQKDPTTNPTGYAIAL